MDATLLLESLETKLMTQLKAIASELGIKPTGDSRRRETWVQAIRHAAAAYAGAVTEAFKQSAPAAAAETTVEETTAEYHRQLTIEEAAAAVSPTTCQAAAYAGAVTEAVKQSAPAVAETTVVEYRQLTIEEAAAAVSPTTCQAAAYAGAVTDKLPFVEEAMEEYLPESPAVPGEEEHLPESPAVPGEEEHLPESPAVPDAPGEEQQPQSSPAAPGEKEQSSELPISAMSIAAPKERPILFLSGEMRAVLGGLKTQARRPILPQPVDFPTETLVKKGDRLWVREACYKVGDQILYQADEQKFGGEWDAYWPNNHMPRDLARLILEVTNVRAERLQEISSADATAEGYEGDLPQQAFAQGWNRKGFYFHFRWECNPWVEVISFRAIALPGSLVAPSLGSLSSPLSSVTAETLTLPSGAIAEPLLNFFVASAAAAETTVEYRQLTIEETITAAEEAITAASSTTRQAAAVAGVVTEAFKQSAQQVPGVEDYSPESPAVPDAPGEEQQSQNSPAAPGEEQQPQSSPAAQGEEQQQSPPAEPGEGQEQQSPPATLSLGAIAQPRVNSAVSGLELSLRGVAAAVKGLFTATLFPVPASSLKVSKEKNQGKKPMSTTTSRKPDYNYNSSLAAEKVAFAQATVSKGRKIFKKVNSLFLEWGYDLLKCRSELGGEFKSWLRHYHQATEKEAIQAMAIACLVDRVPQCLDYVMGWGASALAALNLAPDELVIAVLNSGRKWSHKSIKCLRILCEKGMPVQKALLWIEKNPNNPKGELTLERLVTESDWELVTAIFDISEHELDEIRSAAATYLTEEEPLVTNCLLQALKDFEYDTSELVSFAAQEKNVSGSFQEIASLTAEVERLKRELSSAAAAHQVQTVRETLEKEKEMALQTAAAQFQAVRETLEKEKAMELQAAAAQFQTVRETLEKEKAIALQAAEEKNAQIAQMRLEAEAVRKYLEQIEELQWANKRLTTDLKESRQERAAFKNLMAAAYEKDVTYTVDDYDEGGKVKKVKGCVFLEYDGGLRWKFQAPDGKQIIANYLESITPEETPPAEPEKMLAEQVEAPAPAPAPSECASPVWKGWRTSADAISWAIAQLPQLPKEQLRAEFESLAPINGKKAPAWVDYIQEKISSLVSTSTTLTYELDF